MNICFLEALNWAYGSWSHCPGQEVNGSVLQVHYMSPWCWACVCVRVCVCARARVGIFSFVFRKQQLAI